MSRPTPTMTKEMMEEQGLALYVRAKKLDQGVSSCETAVNATAEEAIDLATQVLVNIVRDTAKECDGVNPLKLLMNMFTMQKFLDAAVERMSKDGLAELKAKQEAEQMLHDPTGPVTVQ